MLLVRTPQPYPAESLKGYLLRVTERNGYISPWRLYSLAGLCQREMNTAGMPSAKLAPLVSVAPDALDHLAYQGVAKDGEREFRLLGHSLGKGLSTSPLRLEKPSVCPHCIAESGYIDAFFDLALAVACPIHACSLVERCPKCDEPLTWFRSRLLHCKCGSSFVGSPMRAAPDAVVDLMGVIWAVLHRMKDLPSPSKTGMPVEHLLRTSLQALVVKIPALAECLRPESSANPMLLVEGAAEALRDWPKGFHGYLKALAADQASKPSAAFRKRYESFYTRLFKQAKYAGDFAWLRDEFVRYGLNHAGDVAVDPKMVRRKDEARRFVSKAELARILGVSPVTLKRWEENSAIELREVSAKSRTYYVADAQSEQFQLKEATEGRVMSPREAAAFLNLPVSVLKEIKRSEHYKPVHRLKQKGAFHQADLNAFRQQLLAMSSMIEVSALDGQDTVTLKHALGHYRFHDHANKAGLLIGYLEGTLVAVGRTGDSVSAIHLPRVDVQAFVAASRSAAAGYSLSQQEAARTISCDPQAIPALLDKGMLQQVAGREGVRISRPSVNDFAGQYTSLSKLAHQHGTSSRRLSAICDGAGIPLLRLPRTTNAGDIPFIKSDRVAEVTSRLRPPSPNRR